MCKARLILLIFVMALSLLTGCGGMAAPASDKPAEMPHMPPVGDETGIMIMEPMARAGGPNGAVYMKLMNNGSSDDALIGGSTDVAEVVEIHESIMDGNTMKMRPVEKIAIPAGGSATLEPGGLHVMLIGLKKELAQGDKISLTLNFEHAAPLTIEAPVMMGAGMNMGNMQQGDHN